MERIANVRFKGAKRLFRRRIPRDLQVRIERREIVRSLQSVNTSDLRRLSRLLWAETERVFGMIRADEGLSPQDCQRLLDAVRIDREHYFESQLARFGAVFPASGPAPIDGDAQICETFSDEITSDLAVGDLKAGQRQVAKYAKQLGISVEPFTLRESMMARLILRQERDSLDAIAIELRKALAASDLETCPALQCTECGYTERDGSHDKACEALAITEPPSDGQGGQSHRCTDEPAPSLDELWSKFTSDAVRTKVWGRDQARQSGSTASAWKSLFPALSVRDIQPKHGASFQRTMLDLPAMYSKSTCWRDRPLHEVAEERRKILKGDKALAAMLERANKGRPLVLKPLSNTTFNRHLSALTTFWKWAKRNSYVDVNALDPFADCWVKTRDSDSVEEGGSAERPIWTDDQLKTLFSSPLYAGCQSPHRRYKPGGVIVKDALFWVPIIAATTGMRREEIAQLRVGDVKCDVDIDIWHIDLTRKDLKLKNRESRRRVPLPNALLGTGIIDLLVIGRHAEEQLFSELTPNAKGVYGDAVGKKFRRYRLQIGLSDDYLDIHAFRHTIATALLRHGVPQAHGEEVLGHRSEARRTAFVTYDKGATLLLLKQALDRVPTDWLMPAHPN